MVPRKLCYVFVVDDKESEVEFVRDSSSDPQSNASFCYTRPVLQSVLQLVGCKVHHAFKISRRVFDILESENLQPAVNFEDKEIPNSHIGMFSMRQKYFEDVKKSKVQPFENIEEGISTEQNDKSFDLYKKETTVTVKRGRFLNAICGSLEEYHYVGPSQRSDIILACRLRERKESVTILLCGTSGCGKSTLSSLLASRLGITTVVSTDSIRHMMRSFIDEKDNPLLFASTYHAGEFLDPFAVAEAKAKRKDRKLSNSHGGAGFEESTESQEKIDVKADYSFSKASPPNIQSTQVNFSEQVGSKVLAVEGYKAQSEMVIDSLDRLITRWEDLRESVVVEGVHLSLNFVMGLMKKHPSIIPFLIYIADEEKHLERFAIRAKYMTLDPSKNKYVKYMKNIRTIQDYLIKRADKHLVPKVNNTNVDQSVASIHSTIFSCLRRREMGISLYDVATNTVKVIHEEYCKQCDANSVSSKRMFRMIQRQGSLRRYMAIVNSDGSVAKAWPFSHVEKNGEFNSSGWEKSAVGSPIYGPVEVREAKPVNVQFGNFGIGAWPNDTEGTSYVSSLNGSRVDEDEEVLQFSSYSSSPLHSEGHAKELTEDVAVSESEEEPLPNEEDDSSDANEFGDELGGSIVESSTRSDDEYEEDQTDGRLNDDAVETEVSGHSANLYDAFHKESKLSKCYPRTLSMALSRIPTCNGRLYRRSHSLPLQRSRSNKFKNVTNSKFSSTVCEDGCN
ncbi:P-loop NTPase domain-containing protein LPA1 homolog 1-like [Tasmannia lanceolata]|uniref:P-loop NTPase domain-containing protein LPA1 homolog 1-like n=1 Tax=Tasmannia lanceolata TaxID=3420 RepID=UPI0040637B6F